MALTDVLRERVSRRGRTAQVDCGELGTLTVEALPPRECSALGMADGGRALLYAACRELQAAGETLRRERRLFTPDEVTQYVSDKEARTAARTVMTLSGATPEEDADETDGLDKDENRLASVRNSGKDLSEIRPGAVQEADSLLREVPENQRTRLETVQEAVNQFSEIRPGIVQFPEEVPANGQVSREFPGDGKSVRGTPSVGVVSDFEPLNLVLSEKNDNFVAPFKLPGDDAEESGRRVELHEIRSNFSEKAAGTLHETTSEVEEQAPYSLHETTSEFWEGVHEPKSEFGVNGQQTLHEIKSEVRKTPHEIKSELRQPLHETETDFQDGLHETKSEIHENRREALHETASELAEQVAERLLEGLRRAAAVR